MNYKNIIKYLLCLLPWFISSIIFKANTSYYKSLNLPFFAPPTVIFPIIWTLLFILISISLYLTIDNSNSNYKLYLLINYLSNQLYTFCFFTIKNNFLAFIDCLIVLISSLYLYKETKNTNNSSKYLIPYIIWNIFATILSLTILIIN
ncbi:MAG: tryptophan-rich sensory protein [Bacilli bacterium]|nr:tryptophan-rich sensory protein [Bacilli bacterium]